ncbi:MFS transporter [Clostridium manihotivorum]|uniref:MFS transporter n=1 Tax=Clostridium manihotivorum TaxID=2320868 RepID=A0A410DRX4_9CLOT|nr:MFS transporter [Clostridium manihotivorum]QAA31790.1 MFS transporter [Clostridium manihotivorum]
MPIFFLIIIYLAFISLGLPDSLLGVAWPVMHLDLGAKLEAAGIISMSIAGGTIASSLASNYVLKKLGTGKVTLISCFMTASALLGFSLVPSFLWLILLAIPLGLGAGSVDAGLNNYVANHYKAHHMIWLHCFWGVGATLGPIIMSSFIGNNSSWRNGYRTVAFLQFSLVILLFVTLPLWKKVGGEGKASNDEQHKVGEIDTSQDSGDVKIEKDNSASIELEERSNYKGKENVLKFPGVNLALISFLFYCAGESTIGLWGSSFLVNTKHFAPATAASWVSLYYGGITVGRLITGFITMKLSNKILIRAGQIISFIGVLLLILPLPKACSFLGFIMIGIGFAPIFPCMLHETPVRFGKVQSQKIIGYQMAAGYIGATFLPPVLGFIAARTTISIMPFFVLTYISTMLYSSERINIVMRGKKFYKAHM